MPLHESSFRVTHLAEAPLTYGGNEVLISAENGFDRIDFLYMGKDVPKIGDRLTITIEPENSEQQLDL
jgi:hypothetical protein